MVFCRLLYLAPVSHLTSGADIDGLGLRIEADFRFTSLKLTPNRGAFTGKDDFLMAVVSTFTQHKGFDDALQGIFGELFEQYLQNLTLSYRLDVVRSSTRR